MNKLLHIVLIASFSFISYLNAQNVDNKSYLLALPYNGYEGKPVSLEINSYTIKEGLNEKDFEDEKYQDITEDERYNILRGKKYATNRYEFDKKGFIKSVEYRKLSDSTKKKGKLITIYKQEIERDENSLATKRTITRNGKTNSYYLVNRKNNREIYETKTSKGKRQKLVLEYCGDTIKYSAFNSDNKQTITEVIYNHKGLLTYWGETTPDGIQTEYFCKYAYGYLDFAGYSISKKESDKPLFEEFFNYMLYENDENNRWVRRDVYSKNGNYINDNPTGFDEMIATY